MSCFQRDREPADIFLNIYIYLLKFAEEFDHECECEHKHTVENSRANAVLHVSINLVEFTRVHGHVIADLQERQLYI